MMKTRKSFIEKNTTSHLYLIVRVGIAQHRGVHAVPCIARIGSSFKQYFVKQTA